MSIDIDHVGRATLSHQPTGPGGKRGLVSGPKDPTKHKSNGSENRGEVRVNFIKPLFEPRAGLVGSLTCLKGL